MWRTRQSLGDDARDLFQLVHQATARMQAASRVDHDDVGVAGDGSVDGVEGDSGRIAPSAPTNEVGAGTVGPHTELVDRAGAKGVGRTDDNTLALPPQQMCQLPDKGSFACPVDAEYENDRRTRRGHTQRRFCVPSPQHRFDTAAQRLEKLILRPDVTTLGLLLDLGDEAERGRDTKISLEQRLLELLQ